MLDDEIIQIIIQYPGFRNLLEQINGEVQSRGLNFKHTPTYNAKNRAAFVVYQGSDLKNAEYATLGLIVQTGKERNYDDRAWNRLDEKARKWALKYQTEKLKSFVLQVWHNLDSFLVVPLGLLKKLPTFMGSGNFIVRNDGEKFRLQGQVEYLPSDCYNSLKLLFSHYPLQTTGNSK